MARRLWNVVLFLALPASSLTFQEPAVVSAAGLDDDLVARKNVEIDTDELPPVETEIWFPADADVLVFAFDRRTFGHMSKTIFRPPYSFKYVLAKNASLVMNVPFVDCAFEVVERHKPKLALWLLTFKDGDKEEPDKNVRLGALNIVSALSRGFLAAKQRSPATRHGVFHWAPEACDRLPPDIILSAYRPVDFVFQFGYQDERLSSADPKYMPWPLGAAYFRGWRTPDKRFLDGHPTSQRHNLASYRGSATTRRAVVSSLSELRGYGGVVVEFRAWHRKDRGQETARYRELMATSQYALSPAGNNPNCYRVQEAVESGCIPVIVPGTPGEPGSCYRNWSGLYGLPVEGATNYPWIPAAPFRTLASWSEFGNHVDALRAGATDQAGHELQTWYKRWLDAFRSQLELQVRGLLDQSYLLDQS